MGYIAQTSIQRLIPSTKRSLEIATFILAVLVAPPALAANVAPPPKIAATGKIVYCSDISSPPLEYYNTNSQPVGSDIEIGNAIAEEMGLKPVWKNIPFSGIIPALLAGHCDAIISQLFDKPERRKVIDMVDYMYSSEALLVKKGHSHGIHGLADLSGMKVAVENGTTIADLLQKQNKFFEKSGKRPMDIIVFPTDTDALQQLVTGQVDAYGTTLETGAYYIKTHPRTFAVAGKPFHKILTGVGVRKDDPALAHAIQKAVDHLRTNGTYDRILKKWGISGDSLQHGAS